MNINNLSSDELVDFGFTDIEAMHIWGFAKEGFTGTLNILEDRFYAREYNRITLKRNGVSVRFDSGPHSASVNVFIRCSTGGYKKWNDDLLLSRGMTGDSFDQILALKGGEIIRKSNLPDPKKFASNANDTWLGANRKGQVYARILERKIVKATILGLVTISDDGRLSFDGLGDPNSKPWFLFMLERGARLGHVFAIYANKRYLPCVRVGKKNYRIVVDVEIDMTKWKDVVELTSNEHKLMKFAIQKFQEGLE